MIMPRGANQLLLPANPLFIAFTLALACGFNMLPVGRVAGMPDLLAVALVFWNVYQPRRVGVGVAFVFGLLIDVHQGALLGQHALAYTLLSFAATSIHRRLLVFALVNGISVGISDSIPISSAFVVSVVLMAAIGLKDPAVGLMAGGMFPGWWLLLAPLLQALLWPVAMLVLLAPQRRAPDPDQNRPL